MFRIINNATRLILYTIYSHAVLPPTLNLTGLHNGDNYEPAEAWHTSPSPVIGSSHGMAPPPPFTDRTGDVSHRSKREELIQQDWLVPLRYTTT